MGAETNAFFKDKKASRLLLSNLNSTYFINSPIRGLEILEKSLMN